MTDAVQLRRGRPRSELIDAAILDATVEEIIEHGAVALSMEAVAARAGVAKTTLYRRWPNSIDLVLEAMRMFHEEVAEPPPGSARDDLLWLIERMRRKWNDPRYAAMMRRVAADGNAQPELYRQSRERIVGPHLRRMNEAIQRCVDDGLIRGDYDVNWIRQQLCSPILSSAMTLNQTVSKAQAARTVDVVLRGLAP